MYVISGFIFVKWNDQVVDDDEFSRSIFSLEFERYINWYMPNDNRRRGQQDIEFNQAINQARQRGSESRFRRSQSMGNNQQFQQQDINIPQGGVYPGQEQQQEKNRERMRQLMRAKLISTFSIASFGDCPICIFTFRAGDEIVDLPCHIKHQVHKECFEDFAKFYEKNRKPILCPICRAPVEKEKIMTITLKEEDLKKKAWKEY